MKPLGSIRGPPQGRVRSRHDLMPHRLGRASRARARAVRVPIDHRAPRSRIRTNARSVSRTKAHRSQAWPVALPLVSPIQHSEGAGGPRAGGYG
jgi:hypothetical protein